MADAGNGGRLFGAALLLALLVVGGWWLSCPKAVAVVGGTQISETDIGYRIGVEQAYGSTLARETALVALVSDALEREVARSVGMEVTGKELDDFSAYVDANSKAPEVLAKVKRVFGDDSEAYRRLWLAPKAVNRKLHDWFNRDAVMQQEPRKLIRQAYVLAAGNVFEKTAKATELKFAAQEYKAEKQDAPDALAAYFPEGMPMLSPGLRKLLDGLRPGEMAGTIAEDDSSYRVVRLLEKGDGRYKTEEIIAAKAPFDPWFKKQVKKVRVEIHNGELRNAIVAKYPSMAWLPAD